MTYELRKAMPGEEGTMYSMISERVQWMNENGIHQWNDTDYLHAYPLEYYRQNLARIYVLLQKETNRIVSCAILFEEDARWVCDVPAFYIHNFVSAPESPGAGTLFMQMLEEHARKEGIAYLRLDSAAGNEKLAAYYEKLGFEACGTCQDGMYRGICRQKKL